MVPITRRNRRGSFTATLAVYDFSSEALKLDADGVPKPLLLRTFFLPRLNPQLVNVEFTCCSSLTNRSVWTRSEGENGKLESFASNCKNGVLSMLNNEKPFRAADEDRLCALILETHSEDMSTWGGTPYTYVIITNASTLLADYQDEWCPWVDWGEKNAACLHGTSNDLRWGNCW